MKFDMLTKKQKIIAIVGIIGIILIIGYCYINSTKNIYEYEDFEKENEINEMIEDKAEENTIIVHITGAVLNEGIVEVKENARINDVIEAAGGLTEDADIDSVNLAYSIEDGQKIYIPSKDNAVEDGEKVSETQIITKNAGEKVIENPTNMDFEETGGLININTANAETLKELPGIGNATAQKIISYRKENRQI